MRVFVRELCRLARLGLSLDYDILEVEEGRVAGCMVVCRYRFVWE